MPNPQIIDPALLQLAEWSVDRMDKRAFVPAGQMPMGAAGDPAAMGGGGGMPMDPSMMGGGGGMPPMDPAMMGGGGMPMDPSMMGGGGMPPMDPSMMGGMGGGMPGQTPSAAQELAAGAAQGKKPKLEPTVLYLELFRLRKMMMSLFKNLGFEIPEDLLYDQNILAPGVVPQQEQPAPQEEQQPPGLPAVGGSSAVQPMAPAPMAGQ